MAVRMRMVLAMPRSCVVRAMQFNFFLFLFFFDNFRTPTSPLALRCSSHFNLLMQKSSFLKTCTIHLQRLLAMTVGCTYFLVCTIQRGYLYGKNTILMCHPQSFSSTSITIHESLKHNDVITFYKVCLVP